MIVKNPDETLTVACDTCGIGCPAPLEGHLTPSDAYEGARRHQWEADPYIEDRCPSCALAAFYLSFTPRYMMGYTMGAGVIDASKLVAGTADWAA